MDRFNSVVNIINDPGEWHYSSPNNEYKIKVSFIGEDIVHLDVFGYANTTNRKHVSPKVQQLIKEKLKNRPYYLVHNFEGLTGSSHRPRYDYINWLKNNSDQIQQIYFYGINPLIGTLIKAGILLSQRVNYAFIKKELSDVLSEIRKHRNLDRIIDADIWELQNISDIFFQDWKEGKVFKSRSGNKYTTIKRWDHHHEECSTTTYLLNENIFVRMYIGDFGDYTITKVEYTINEILKEIGLWKKPYHLYIDFSRANKVSLKFRKDAVKWYLAESRYLLSVGLFHLKPFQKIAASIAKRIAHERTREKIFILNNAIEIFDTIENVSFGKNNGLLREKQLNKLSKQELIDKILKIEEDQEKEINEIYLKLGRLSWDEENDWDKFEIDQSDSPFADIHNTLRLVQEDLHDILSKRDHLIHRAEESDQLKSAFLANMSHEIRTPMNSIVGFCELLKDMEEIPNEAVKYLDVIQRNSHYLLTLINDIIDISKIEADQLNVSRSLINLNDFLDEIQEILKMQMKASSKDLQIEFKNELFGKNITFLSDPVRLKQAIYNLISNAIKFTKEGFVGLKVGQKEKDIVFEISDSGIGISLEDQQHLFTRFSRSADQQKNIKYKGSGLGLPISKACIELLEGSIEVESELGKGSIFTIQIPIN